MRIRRSVLVMLAAVLCVAPAIAGSPLPASAAPAPSPGIGRPSPTPAPLPGLAGKAHRRVCSTPLPHRAACLAEVVEGVATPAVTGGAPVGFGPADLRAAYALPATGGAGATVAVIDAYDLPSAESDLAAYRSQYGLPACTSANGCFRKVDQRGGSALPAVDPGLSWGPETAIDIEMVAAACPNCRILLVEADDASVANLGAAADTAVQLGARYMTNSYGVADTTADLSAYEPHYDHPGVVVTAASGDNGQGTQFPASSQYVTAVGGTTLSRASGTARGWTEAAWSGSGSGCSPYSPKPAWQTDTGCASRTVSDISAVADPSTGVAGYGPVPGTASPSVWQVFGGTSVASPLIAGMYALAGTPATGTFPASYPYSHPKALNDIVQGSTGTGCTPAYACTAGPGYDGPTGLGSPNGVSALAAPGAAAPPSAPLPPVQNDFNSDSTSDVLARAPGGALLLYRGDGHGGWRVPTSSQVGSGWDGMTAIVSPGDFDGDGHNDVLARDASGALWLYPGDGAGGWFPRRQVGSGWNIMTTILAAHDFSGRGTADILAVDGSGTLWLYPGDGHGSWRSPQAVGSGWGVMSAVVGIEDFDGDGAPDVLARDSAGRLWLYAHTSAGWKAPVVVGTGWNIMSAVISVGDFDGDGHDDILGRTTSGALILYPGNGRSSWLAARQVGSGWQGMTWLG